MPIRMIISSCNIVNNCSTLKFSFDLFGNAEPYLVVISCVICH